MRRIRVYVGTSVFGGVCDDEFADASRPFFDRVRKGEFVVLLSRLTTDELENAPPEVLGVLQQLPPEAIERVPLSDSVHELAEQYVRAGVLEEACRDDAIHIAAATLAGADLVLSWNFKHIVNFRRICGYNSVNMRNGYRTMMILSPREVLGEGEDEDI